MKVKRKNVLLLFVLTLAIPTIAAPSPEIAQIETSIRSERTSILLNRLEEIKASDPSSMMPNKKKELRMEIRSINKELNQLGGGVYLSAGAVIIIVLLLILLL